jgi:DNA-binding transcriptional ArsR family regulator
MPADLAALENLFLGLADKTRLRLLGLMAEGPVAVGHLVSETGESQPKISRHLAYLRNAGLVDTTRDGKWIYYGLADLADAAAGSVFRCVVDEMSGKTAGAGPPMRSQARRPEPQSSAPAIHDFDAEVTSDDAPEIEWQHPLDKPAHNELEVFLL